MNTRRPLLPVHPDTLLSSRAIYAQAESRISDADNVVLDGYGVVEYGSMDRAGQDSASYSTACHGAGFRLANADHPKTFETDPQRHTPRYSGFCAIGVGATDTGLPAGPDSFRHRNGQLPVLFNDMRGGGKAGAGIRRHDGELPLYSKAKTNWTTLQNTR